MTLSRWMCSFLLCTAAVLVCDATRRPTASSSPGWKASPYSVSVMVGARVHFSCRSTISHTRISWFFGGSVEGDPSKLTFSRGNVTASYGPIGVKDNGVAIGCEVLTAHGRLPSKLGKITVYSVPRYNTKKLQTAYAGRPFEFDFGYGAPLPPSLYVWYKNGKVFSGDGKGGRVTVDHTGITFTTVRPSDAGKYSIRASVKSKVVTAVSVLKVILFKQGDRVQTSLTSTPVSSKKLAVLVALNSSYDDASDFPTTTPTHHTSEYAERVIRLFRKFKKPTPASRKGGNARVQTEHILLAISKLLGSGGNLSLTENQMALISDHAKCIAEKRRPKCTYFDLKFRRIDGTCNNFFFPLNGASETEFARLLPPFYEDGISAPVGQKQQLAGDHFSPPWPSPRHVSFNILRDLPKPNTDGMTHMFMQWGQFVDHDLDIAPVFDEDGCDCNFTRKCIPIEVNPSDKVFGEDSENNGDCLPFSRSTPACSHRWLPRNQVNDLTSYIDASNVYGSTQAIANQLRLFKGGLLRQGNRQKTLKGNLPFQEDSPDFSDLPFFFAGDERANEQLGLTMIHTIWMREHNRIARALGKLNPCWDDERVYQEARKIVGALQQVISYKEFLPLLFGSSNFEQYIPRYRGYNPFVDASVPNVFAAAAYRFGHSLVRPEFERLDRNYRRLSIGPLPLEQAFFNPMKYFESFGTDPFMRGLTVAKSNPLDEFLNSVLTSQLFVEPGKNLGGDLASLNIQRGRDHGLPTYRNWERFCKRLYPNVEASFEDPATVQRMKKVYGSQGFLRGMDLWVAGLAEKALPGSLLGPTFACIVGTTFNRLRDGDRFWYENPYVFTAKQRQTLQQASLAKVVCTNGDDIPTIQPNVFMAGQRRVKCSSLPALNLSFWWDRRCRRNRHSYRG